MASVLIVDDDQQIVKLLSKVLANAGHQTLVASNGAEAIRLYNSEHPELVVTDIIMPEMEGLETIKTLMDINPRLKVIAISGGGIGKPATYLKIAQKLGAAATLEKPFRKEDLLNTVERALSG